MIALPFNDLKCLGSITEVIAELVTNEDPVIHELYIPVYTVQAGEVAFAVEGVEGFSVTIDHGGIATHYGHLSRMFVTQRLRRSRRRQYVRAGEEIGYAAKSPVHIRFEVWNWTDDRGFVSVAPQPYLEQWKSRNRSTPRPRRSPWNN